MEHVRTLPVGRVRRLCVLARGPLGEKAFLSFHKIGVRETEERRGERRGRDTRPGKEEGGQTTKARAIRSRPTRSLAITRVQQGGREEEEAARRAGKTETPFLAITLTACSFRSPHPISTRSVVMVD